MPIQYYYKWVVKMTLWRLAKGLALAAAITGISAACGIHPRDSEKCYPVGYCNGGNGGGIPVPPQPEIPLEITSEPPLNGIVGSPYSYEITTSEKAECSLLVAPKWMDIANNEIYGIPWHINNSEVGYDPVVVMCRKGDKRTGQSFKIEIEPGQPWEQFCRTYDAIYPVDFDRNGNIKAVVPCETGYCPPVYRDNNGNLEMKAEGVGNARRAAVSAFGMDVLPSEIPQPIEIHVAGPDSSCTLQYT